MSFCKRAGALIAFLIAISSGNVVAADWKTYGRVEPFVSYYDAENLNHHRDIVRVWTREECSDESKCKELYKEWIRESKGEMSQAYENWGFRISFVEINCNKKALRFLSVKNFDKDGNKIDGFEDATDWDDIKNPWGQAEDPMENLYKSVCK